MKSLITLLAVPGAFFLLLCTCTADTADVADLRAQAGIYQAAGDYFTAKTLLESALEQSREDSVQSAWLHGRLAEVMLSLQRPGAAWEHLVQAFEREAQQPQPRLLVYLLNVEGNRYSFEEEYVYAGKAYREAFELAAYLEDPLLEARLAVNLALNAARLDVEFEPQWQAARARVEALPDSADKSALLLSLADTGLNAVHLRQTSATAKIYARSLSLWERVVLSNLRSRSRGGEGEEISARYEIPFEVSEESNKLPLYPLLQSVLQLSERRDDPLAGSYAHGYLAQLYERRGRLQEARRLTRQAIFLAQESPDPLFRWEWQLGRLFQSEGEIPQARAAYERALTQLAPIRARLMLGRHDARRVFREYIRPVYLSLVDVLLQQAAELEAGADKTARLQRVRGLLESFRSAELENYFRDACVSRAREEAGTQPLPARTAALYPVLLPDRTELLLYLPEQRLLQFSLPVSGTLVSSTALTFRHKLQIKTRWDFARQAMQLYAWLIAPIEPALATHQVETLVIVPDGPLRLIPFSALHNSKQYLVEKYAIAVTPGLSLTRIQAPASRRMRIFLNGLTSGVQNFSPLPGVSTEIDQLKTLYGSQAEVLFDQAFVLADFTRHLQQAPYDIIHVASHGQFTRDPDNTFLLTYDTKLTINRLEDLFRFNRARNRDVELLALSACQTALGDDRAALGLAGVAVKAGVKSALASLWFVNDDATSQLIRHFYAHLQAGQPKAQALQAAQRQLLADSRLRHPLLWAPFLLIGNWQ